MEEKEQQKNQYSYTYTYSSSEREELDTIRRKYLPTDKRGGETDALARVRQIEARVESVGNIFALLVGLFGTLLLGVGMCCVLVWMDVWFYVGIPVGVLGLGVMMSAYPIYLFITRRMRARYAQEVLELTENKE